MPGFLATKKSVRPLRSALNPMGPDEIPTTPGPPPIFPIPPDPQTTPGPPPMFPIPPDPRTTPGPPPINPAPQFPDPRTTPGPPPTGEGQTTPGPPPMEKSNFSLTPNTVRRPMMNAGNILTNNSMNSSPMGPSDGIMQGLMQKLRMMRPQLR